MHANAAGAAATAVGRFVLGLLQSNDKNKKRQLIRLDTEILTENIQSVFANTIYLLAVVFVAAAANLPSKTLHRARTQ